VVEVLQVLHVGLLIAGAVFAGYLAAPAAAMPQMMAKDADRNDRS
jgi:hypothetical protein